MSATPRILLVELGDSHGEVLLTQVEACLDAGVHCELVANTRLLPRLHPSIGERIAVHGVRCDGPLRRLLAAGSVRRRVRAGAFTHLVLNTASGNAVQLLSALIPPEVRAVGILHDVKRLRTSSRQGVISRRVKDYLVLADHLVPGPGEHPELRFGAFYPIAYPPPASPEPPASTPHQGRAPAGAPSLRLVVPGGISLRRRDYLRLVDLMAATPAETRRTIRVDLLGDITRGDGPVVLAALREAGVLDRVSVHEGFVPETDFYRAAAECDAILPLLPLSADGVEAYGRHRISGSFNLAYACRKPLLIDARWRGHPDLDAVGIELVEGAGLPAPARFAEARRRVLEAYASLDRFDRERQKARWLDFVLDR